eukprot:7746907-Prorocentrum_lima.AAC.1
MVHLVKPRVGIDPYLALEREDGLKPECMLEVSLCSGEPFFKPIIQEGGIAHWKEEGQGTIIGLERGLLGH